MSRLIEEYNKTYNNIYSYNLDEIYVNVYKNLKWSQLKVIELFEDLFGQYDSMLIISNDDYDKNNIKKKSSQCEVVDGDYQFDRVCQFKTKEEKTKEDVLKERYLRFNFIIVDTNLDKTLATLDSVEDLVTEKK